MLDRIVIQESSKGGDRGEVSISIASIDPHLMEELSQNFSLDVVSARIVWRKGGVDYFYLLQGTAADGLTTQTREFRVGVPRPA